MLPLIYSKVIKYYAAQSCKCYVAESLILIFERLFSIELLCSIV